MADESTTPPDGDGVRILYFCVLERNILKYVHASRNGLIVRRTAQERWNQSTKVLKECRTDSGIKDLPCYFLAECSFFS